MNTRDIQEQRQTIAQFINTTSSVMSKRVAHPFNEKTTIPYGQSRATWLIADMEDTLAILLIIKILTEIKNFMTTPAECESLQHCLFFFEDIEKRQQMSVQEIINFLSDVDKIKKELALFVENCKKLSITSDTFHLYREFNVYLDGLYLHFYKDKDNFLDFNNAALKMATHGALDKMIIATYYYEAAEVIKIKLSEALPQDPLPPAVLEKLEEIEITEPVSEPPIQVSSLMTNEITIDTPTQQGESNEECQAPVFGHMLYESRHASDETRIDSLYNALNKYNLTKEQIERLFYLKARVIADIQSYLTNTYFKPILGRVSALLFPRVHKFEANLIIAQMNKIEDRKQMLIDLYNMHLTLRNDSNDLNAIIERILLEAYIKLLNHYMSEIEQKTKSTLTFFQPTPLNLSRESVLAKEVSLKLS